MPRSNLLMFVAFVVALACSTSVAADAPFTFQGFLEQSGSPIDRDADLEFRLYDQPTSGNQLGNTNSVANYPVVDGVLTIDLLFTGVVFSDAAGRWLEVEVDGVALVPRIEVMPAPYSATTYALQGRKVSNEQPAVGQVLKWNGAVWSPQTDAGGTTYSAGAGLTLAGTTFSVNFAGSGAANSLARSDHDHYGSAWSGSSAQNALAVQQTNAGSGTTAVLGANTAASGVTFGLVGTVASTSAFSAGVLGSATATSGVVIGVHGRTGSPSNGARGVFGEATAGTGDTYGVHGRSNSSVGRGVFGLAGAAVGANVGVLGETLSGEGRGVFGLANNTSGVNFGVWGESRSSMGVGVYGSAPASAGSTVGVYGASASAEGVGVRGFVSASAGATVGVFGGSVSTGGIGVRGEGETGVIGQGQSMGVDAAASDVVGQAIGVRGSSGSAGGAGVFAINSASSGDAFGAYAQTNSTAGRALVGDALATTGPNLGMLARTASGQGAGLRAENAATSGAGDGHALVAIGNLPSGDTMLVEANGASSAWAIRARSAGSRVIDAQLTSTSTTGAAIAASVNSSSGRAGQFINVATGGMAAQFVGNVDVSGTLSKSGGTFRIDHPLDPANKYLQHSFVESPDMMNIYNGNIVTDLRGYATVQLPEWFGALNRDFRYQLTVIGSFSRAMVAEEVVGDRFVIQSELPNTKVSWQVTGIRQDAWAEAHRFPVEVEKLAKERGRFLHPELHGQPANKRLGADSSDDEKASTP